MTGPGRGKYVVVVVGLLAFDRAASRRSVRIPSGGFPLLNAVGGGFATTNC